MNIFFLNLLFSFQVLLPLDGETNLASNKQAVDVILPNLSLLGYAVPVEVSDYSSVCLRILQQSMMCGYNHLKNSRLQRACFVRYIHR